MMVVDTSALIAILTLEPDAGRYQAALARSDASTVSAVCVVETTMVASRASDVAATSGVDAALRDFEIEISPVDAEQVALARSAFMLFGKGRGRPAQLNICDCFAYALAKSLDAPLLFKGGDFAKTDVRVAEVPS